MTTTTAATTEPTAPRHSGAVGGAVAVLALAGVVCFAAVVALSNAHTHRQSSGCRWIAVPWTNFAVAYGALAAAVLALVLHFAAARSARRRGGAPQGGGARALSVAGAVVAGLLLVPALVGVHATHSEASASAAHLGRSLCEGGSVPAAWGFAVGR
ncbi:hypothetical protein ACFYXS_30485 [Streptomyces sp. NPDC002574]|uniref:hypothetical protein n=1 Tax=Streptomyces sp. NPDC002574 TaxID=3364652 RepID=UPI0036A8CD64